MKKPNKIGILFILALVLLSNIHVFADISEFQKQLESLPDVVALQKIDNHPFFEETFEVMVEQYVDHGNPQAGKFKQRVIISNFNKFSPVVLVTEGYNADKATKSSYINELSGILEANQVVVEHRYFGKSVVNDSWDYLTIANSTTDLHRIYKIFSRIFTANNKWISTGISKGGSTTMAYHAHYPEDMDIWVPYVGPINYAIEDKRMIKFIENEVSSPQCRQKVYDFQINALKNRDKLQVLLDSVIDANNYTYFIPNDEVFDYCVLEFSFAFWQKGFSCKEIPSDTVSLHKAFNYLIEVSDPDYFSIEGLAKYKPFFVQTLKEFGYYAYNTKPFEPYLHISSTKDYIANVFLKDEHDFTYSKKTVKEVAKAVQKNGSHMLLIYGEYDPWTAGAVVPKRSSDAVIKIKPKGAHNTRIGNMSYAQQADIYMILENWMEED